MSTFYLGWNFGSDTGVHAPGLAKSSTNGDTENESISSNSKLKIWHFCNMLLCSGKFYSPLHIQEGEILGATAQRGGCHSLTKHKIPPAVRFRIYGIKLATFLTSSQLLASLSLEQLL